MKRLAAASLTVAELWLKRVGEALYPDGDESIAVFEKIAQEKSLLCDVKQPRSLKHLKLYWSICHRIANALDRDGLNAEAVSDFFKKATGHLTVIQTKTFGPIERLDSISFTKMDQIAFRDFFERCIRFAYVEWGIPADVFSDLLLPKEERR